MQYYSSGSKVPRLLMRSETSSISLAMLNTVGYFIHICDLFLINFVPVDTQNNVNHNAAIITDHDLGASSMSTSTTVRAPHNTYTIHQHKFARDELQQYAAAVNSAPLRRRAAPLHLNFLFIHILFSLSFNVQT